MAVSGQWSYLSKGSNSQVLPQNKLSNLYRSLLHDSGGKVSLSTLSVAFLVTANEAERLGRRRSTVSDEM
jgi:hypothetical protein